MARTLLHAARDADEVAAGLQLFLDHIPQRETDLEGCIEELLALAAAFREIAERFPDYDTISQRLTADVDLCLRSLGFTLRYVRGMFGETRHIKYSGERPYRRAWEDLEDYFAVKERGPSLLSRLETYDIFIQAILASLRGSPVDAQSIVQNRARIRSLLDRQESIDQAFAGMSFNEGPVWPPRRPPLPRLNPFPFPTSSTMSPVWSDESDNGIFPPAPEPPNPWSPQSPTLSNNSASTWTSNSSATRKPVNHWATRVFDGKHSRTTLFQRGDPINCFGRAEFPGVLQRLATENFYEVVRLPLDAANFYIRFFWRPSDHRARILCSKKDGGGTIKHYCIPLTALKLTRTGPMIHLWRLDRGTNEFNLWAVLTFQIYETLALFHCAFAAMKSQDHTKFPDVLQDKYHKRERSEEKEEFSAEIKDDDFLHALRIYRDKDSGCIRLEARPRRGSYQATPIWTAFITDSMKSKTWVRVAGTRTITLEELHPYIFCPNYTPPSSKNGKFKLQFTKATDAANFIEMVKTLAS